MAEARIGEVGVEAFRRGVDCGSVGLFGRREVELGGEELAFEEIRLDGGIEFFLCLLFLAFGLGDAGGEFVVIEDGDRFRDVAVEVGAHGVLIKIGDGFTSDVFVGERGGEGFGEVEGLVALGGEFGDLGGGGVAGFFGVFAFDGFAAFEAVEAAGHFFKVGGAAEEEGE